MNRRRWTHSLILDRSIEMFALFSIFVEIGGYKQKYSSFAEEDSARSVLVHVLRVLLQVLQVLQVLQSTTKYY
jgi:hypothetical protein